LATTFGESLRFRVPGGGTSIHATVGGDVDVEAVVDRAYELGLSLQSPRTFAFDGRTKPFLRLGFAQHDEAELAKAVAILARVLPRAKPRRPRAGPSPDRAAAP
jgi:GntR family transcriptional regulator/MocR family aminotransferase